MRSIDSSCWTGHQERGRVNVSARLQGCLFIDLDIWKDEGERRGRWGAARRGSRTQRPALAWHLEAGMPNAGVVRVCVVAQNRLMRDALTRLFGKRNDTTPAGSFGFSPIVVSQITQVSPDVVVMDWPGTGQFEFLRAIQHASPLIRVVLIGMDADEELFLRVVREGVLGYVLGDAHTSEVVSAVRGVANGEAVSPPLLCAALFRELARQRTNVPSFHVKLNLGLSTREQQLVLLIARGMTNKEIAAELHLAEQTVRNHVHRMLRKAGANDRLQVVELCRMQGLRV
jgi:DNA-binding NarL/FixJ family response regulator